MIKTVTRETEKYLTTDSADETDFFNYELEILSTNFDDLIIEISDIIILIIQISFRKNQSVVLLLASVF